MSEIEDVFTSWFRDMRMRSEGASVQYVIEQVRNEHAGSKGDALVTSNRNAL